jgi:hypothetical protein
MKKMVFNSLPVWIMITAVTLVFSCKKENYVQPSATTADKLLGTWKIREFILEEYSSGNVLDERTIDNGKEGDSVVFKKNNIVLTYESGLLIEQLQYQVFNDSTLVFENETQKIRKLTGTEMELYFEEDQSGDYRNIQRLYLYR